jgi:hypothetical protein
MIVALVLTVPASAPSPAVAEPVDVAGAGASNCIPIEGKRRCLRAGQRCVTRLRESYLMAGFECRRRGRRLRLVRASEAAVRGDRPVVIGANGLPSLPTVLQAFDKLVSPMPGAPHRPGVLGEAVDASAAIRWAFAYRDQLSPEQQEALNAVLTAPGGPVVGPSEAEGEEAKRHHPLSAAQADPLQQQFETWTRAAEVRLKGHNQVFNHPIRVRYDPTIKDYGQAVPEWVFGVGNDCKVTFGPLANDPVEGPATAVHELIHCLEGEHWQPGGQSPDWITEGLAAWGEAEIMQEWIGRAAPSVRPYMEGWLKDPGADLFRRSYDAIGYWALVKKQGLDPWMLLPQVAQLGSGAAGNVPAYAFLTDAIDLTTAWGPSLAASPPDGAVWDLPSPAALAASGPYKKTRLGNGQRYGAVSNSRGGAAAALDIRADVVRIETLDAVGTFRPRGGADQELFPEQLFCARPGGCRCDDGSLLPARRISRGRALIGISAPDRAGAYLARGERVDAACRNRPDADQRIFEGISVNGVANLEAESGPQDLPRLARFKTAFCSVQRGRFTAQASSAGQRLTITIAGFHDPPFNEGVWDTAFGQPKAVVEFSGRRGAFSNKKIPRTGPAPNGPIVFGEDATGPTRAIVGAAGTLLIDDASTHGVIATGVMRCRF